METGELRLLPKDTPIWSISLQEMIKFEKDVIIEITDTGRLRKNEYCFGKLKSLLYQFMIPTLIDIPNGNIHFEYKKTLPYEIPKPIISTYNIK